MGNMMPDRLAFDEDALFSGRLIDRGRPLKFTLDGHVYSAFRGDTLLSALLAAGVDTAGLFDDDPIGLTPSFFPLVRPVGNGETGCALPLDRTPATSDARYVTITQPDADIHKRAKNRNRGLKRLAQGVLRKRPTSLELTLNGNFSPEQIWSQCPVDEHVEADLIVVGAGVGGLSAARTAIENGLRVALIEQHSLVGGDARFFGAVEGEKRPDAFVHDLMLPLEDNPLLNIFFRTRAFHVENGGVTAHQVLQEGKTVRSRILSFSAAKIVLATGASEKLPLFAGNRLPGICGARDAFRLAANWGVWRGRDAAFCTASSVATQVALLAADMGVRIVKLADSRERPRSRYFEFAKAYGISLTTGTQVEQAFAAARNRVGVQLELAAAPGERLGDPIETDRLIVCGGWQADLSLWHVAGGQSEWDPQRAQLVRSNRLDQVELAGYGAGATTMSQCVESGKAAVLQLGRMAQGHVRGWRESNRHESADGPLPVAPLEAESTDCFLDGGFSLLQPMVRSSETGLKALLLKLKRSAPRAPRIARSSSLNDVGAKVLLGELPERYAGLYAQERCGFPDYLPEDTEMTAGTSDKNHHIESSMDPTKPPAFLSGRFGRRQTTVRLHCDAPAQLETGCPIFSGNEIQTSDRAIGVIYSCPPTGQGVVRALMTGNGAKAGRPVFVRNGTTMVKCDVRPTASASGKS